MNTTSERKAVKFEMKRLPVERLPNIYGYSELNQKLFEALYINRDPLQNEFVESHLPIHFVKFQVYFGTIQKMVHKEDRMLMRLESVPHEGIPFLLIKSKEPNIHLVNPMNWSDEVFTVQEASLAMAILTYNYFFELAKTETEQMFCVFMMEYLKEVVNFNYNSNKEADEQAHNVLGILKLID